MTGDSENQEESAAAEPHSSHPRPTTDDGESHTEGSFRPFRAWASAYEPEESAWSRFRARLASLFKRAPKREDGDESIEQAAEEPLAEVNDAEPSFAAVDSHEEAAHQRAVSPPENYRFPWPRVAADTPEPAPAAPAVPASDVVDEADDFDFDAAFETAPAVTPATPAGSNFLSDAPARDLEHTFETVDDALPAAETQPVADETPPARAKPGFFSRMFKRSSKAVEASAEELEIEVHEDRIEAAAHALDEVGVEQFESFEGTQPAAPATFESVDAALPAATDADRPPESPAPLATPESVESALSGLPIVGDFAPPDVESSRSTLETAAVADTPPVDRTTGEVDVESVPAGADAPERAPIEPGAAAFDGSSTQDIEDKRKTDEIDLVSLEGPTDPMDEPIPTLEVEKKSFWTQSFIGKLFRKGDTEIEKVGADAEEAARASSAFLLAKFRAFYNEIIKFQHQKSEFTAGFATAIVSDLTIDVGPEASAEALSKRLGELLELQAAEAKWMGGEAAERYPDAQYAMAALADEIFTHTEWEGKQAWPKFSLERKLHHSRDAEIEMFRRIDKLLKERPESDVARDLARVYLLVLAAGFQGKWRPFQLTRPLAEYRRRLYEYIYGSDPLMLYAPDRRVFPEAASRTLEGHAVSRFTAAQRWAAILVFLVVSYTVVAHLAWNRVSADLRDVTTRIKTGAANGAR